MCCQNTGDLDRSLTSLLDVGVLAFCPPWPTRHALRIFRNWEIRLLLGQLGDQSVKVIRHAIRVLHTWLPVYQDAARWLRTAQLDSFGEAGTLLKVHIYADEHLCTLDDEGTREAVALWMESFNVRYIEAIDDEVRDSLLSVRRTISGTFSRTSGERSKRAYGVRVRPTLFGDHHVSCHEFGRELIIELKVIDTLVDALSNEQEPMKVKAALMALGHIGSINEGFQLFPIGVVPQMIRMAEEAAVLSVRGAEALARFGWESNHHFDLMNVRKENDQFERRSSPTTAPQIVVRAPHSGSDSHSIGPSSRNRSDSLPVIAS
ncbi:hypothetical protein OSTOST_06308, partial [Ostertagia ostertagi]